MNNKRLNQILVGILHGSALRESNQPSENPHDLHIKVTAMTRSGSCEYTAQRDTLLLPSLSFQVDLAAV
ncbi:hypothetical protein SRHO_G00080360 [Serrasalmus rhombeus]